MPAPPGWLEWAKGEAAAHVARILSGLLTDRAPRVTKRKRTKRARPSGVTKGREPGTLDYAEHKMLDAFAEFLEGRGLRIDDLTLPTPRGAMPTDGWIELLGVVIEAKALATHDAWRKARGQVDDYGARARLAGENVRGLLVLLGEVPSEDIQASMRLIAGESALPLLFVWREGDDWGGDLVRLLALREAVAA